MGRVTKNQFAVNALWKFFEVICRKLISLVIATILARLLMPEAYGVVALTTVFITFADIFIVNGFNVELVRNEKVTDTDYSTVMILSLIFSLILYIILFITAPYIAIFYKTPELKSVLRTITLLLFFQSVATVVRAKGTRELRIKEMSIVSLISSVSGSFIGIIMAYIGCGIWSLVAQQVMTNVFDMLLMLVVFKWRVPLKFSFSVAKQKLKFTTGVLGASFLDFLGNNANSLVIGKAYNSTDLGYYNRGNVYPETISLNTYNSINSVLLPTLASRQDDVLAMKQVVRKVVSLTGYIIIPLMFGLIAVADRFVLVILTENWTPIIGILVYACLIYAINPIRAIGYSIFYAKGESIRSVRIEILRSILMIANLIMVIVILKKSIYVLSAVNVVIAFLIAFATQIQVKACIGYKFIELFVDVAPSFFMSCMVIIVVRLVSIVNLSDFIILVIQILAGTATYISLSIITKNINYRLLWGFIEQKILRNKKIGDR